MEVREPKPDGEIVDIIRNKLNKDRVKLWQPPYTLENGEKGTYPEGMVKSFASELKFSEEDVAIVLEQLRLHSLDKLAQRRRRSETGIVKLNIKIAGKMTVEKAEFPLEVNLLMKGDELRNLISSNCGVPTNRLKLIGCGHVIVDDRSLYEQHVRPDSNIMAIVLTETEIAAQAEEKETRRLEEARKDAEILSNQSWGGEMDDDYYIQIADQSGNPISLPINERKALSLAMTLHESGKSAIRRREYPYALLLLLEADAEFSKCNSSILNAVDNYALLCLDICWCYLCLKSVDHLPDADVRLKKCDECLTRSYGKNLERLQALKGNVSNEQALLMRLHLLQAIAAFHKLDYAKAIILIQQSEKEMSELQVDDNKLSQIMSMGYNTTEARLALRSSRGDVGMAVTSIIRKREERQERVLKEVEEKKKRLLAKQLGRTANGEWVNVDLHRYLLELGFSRAAAAESLRLSNNNIATAVEVLHANPEIASLQDPGPSNFSVADADVAQLSTLGFDEESAKRALTKTLGNIAKAVELLLKHGGLLAPSNENSESGLVNTKSVEELERENEAYERLRQEIPDDEEAHLDLTLEEEQLFLDEYKMKLAEMNL